jgi:hypothetical protein
MHARNMHVCVLSHDSIVCDKRLGGFVRLLREARASSRASALFLCRITQGHQIGFGSLLLPQATGQLAALGRRQGDIKQDACQLPE